MKLKTPSGLIVILSLIASFAFAGFELTADELYGITHPDPKALYYFPILGPRGLWDSWVMVFTALGLLFFSAWILGYLYHASQAPPQPKPKTWIVRAPEDFPLPPTPHYYSPLEDPEPPKEVPGPAEPKEPEVPRGTKAPQKPLSLQDL